MADLKTKKTDQNVDQFVQSVENDMRKADSLKILKILSEIMPEPPKMWGPSIVGFGEYHYKYATGREGDYLRIGFSPRKKALTIYLMDGIEKHEPKLQILGKFKTGKSCLYINKLEEIHIDILKEILLDSLKNMAELYPISTR
jgi:hypothetical protein